jgi:hypothetical protein
LVQGPLGHVGIYRNSYQEENYQFRSRQGVAAEVTVADTDGTMRLVRKGATVFAYYHDGTSFQLIGSDSADANDTRFIIDLATPDTLAGSVAIAFDDFRLIRGDVTCPS